MKFSNKYQKEVDDWVNDYVIGYWSPHEILARLTEETGEVARVINQIYGPKKKKGSEKLMDLKEEIGDVLFTICCLSNSLDIDLDECFNSAMDKCYNRDNKLYDKK